MRLFPVCCAVLLLGCNSVTVPDETRAREVLTVRTEPAAVATGSVAAVQFTFRNDANTDDIPNISLGCSEGTLYATVGYAPEPGTLPSRAELEALVAAGEAALDYARSGKTVSGSVLAYYYWVAPEQPGAYEVAADMKGAFNTGEEPDAAVVVDVR
jgi:hypothetical protein